MDSLSTGGAPKQRDPDKLAQYWEDNPGSINDAIAANPEAWGLTQSDIPGFNVDGQAEPYTAPKAPKDGLGDYQGYVDTAFDNAMRTLSPFHEQSMDRFDQSMINRGLSPGSDGYREAHDNYMRGMNDMTNDAAFEAMGFGAGRYDADRSYGLARDQFDLGEFATMDGINRAWDNIGFRNASYGDSRLDQQFNQLMSMFGFTPVGSANAPNINSGAGYQSQLNSWNNEQQKWSDFGGSVADAASQIDWGGIFGNDAPNSASSQTGGTRYS